MRAGCALKLRRPQGGPPTGGVPGQAPRRDSRRPGGGLSHENQGSSQGAAAQDSALEHQAVIRASGSGPSLNCATGVPAVVLALLLLGAAPAAAQAPAPVISAIQVQGNHHVERQAIQLHIASRAGRPLDKATVDRDVKAIYAMGFFDRVSAHIRRSGGRVVLVYRVRERPLVSDVKFEGMEVFKPTDEKVASAIRVHVGTILEPVNVRATIRGLKQAYEGEGYLDTKISFQAERHPDNSVAAVFRIHEGARAYVTRVRFTGNKAFSASKLRNIMETRQHNLLSFIFGTGVLDHNKLKRDTDRITAFYYQQGYLNVHVGDPVVSRRGNSIVVTLPIDEGPLYRVGAVDLTGELRFPRKELMARLSIKPGQRFDGAVIQHGVLALSDFYTDRGYAYVSVEPRTTVDAASHRVTVSYSIKPGHQILVNRINIVGNTRTEDRVIRRALLIQEQEPYSAEKIRASKARLEQLGYFKSVRITTSPGPEPDEVNLNIELQEGNTASLQLGGGYDSYIGLFGNFVLGDNNLFGGGESASFNAELAFIFRNIALTYTEPWFLDMPVSVSWQLFDNELFLFGFTQQAYGLLINANLPLEETSLKQIGPFSTHGLSLGLGYQFESVGITNIPPFSTINITRYAGYSRVSEIIPGIKRFTVDNPVDPRQGSVQTLNVELAGLGGTPFFKTVLHNRSYYTFISSPTWGDWVYSQGESYGYGRGFNTPSGSLPLFERFFPGGLGGGGDVRGYGWYALGPQKELFNQVGQPFAFEQYGGSQMLLFSNQITFPLLTALGIRGELFVDAGNAYTLAQSPFTSPMQWAYGIGIFWRSPFGPLTVDVARPINPRPNDIPFVIDIGAGSPL